MSRILTNVGGSLQTVRGVIEYRGAHPEATLRELRPAVKQANFETIRFWHRRYLPQHFENSAKSLYGYEPRSRSYLKSKAKVRGHQRPLVWTGDLRANAIRQIRPTGTSKRARGLMPGTQVANFGYSRRPGMPPMRQEMTRTIASERRQMARVHEQTVGDQLRQIRGRTRKRV